jgi:nucleoside-diphosphate-sugar epimerase
MNVVFGAGQVGAPLIERLRSLGRLVRVIRRTRRADEPGEVVTGDAMDARFCERACEGATTVFHCLNADYSAKAWATTLPVMQANLIAAAGKAGAGLVVLDNLYALGRPAGVITEDSPVAPSSEKGRVRARLSQALFDAHRAGRVRAIAGRAAHFFGPGVRQSQLGDRFYERALSGRSAQLFGDPNAQHTFSYAPDVAAALVSLSTAAADAWGQAHLLPVMPAMPTRAFVEKLLARLGSSAAIQPISRLQMRLFSLFAPPVRELIEMNYEWEHDYVVDDSAARARFGFSMTSLDDALIATAAWARHTFSLAA